MNDAARRLRERREALKLRSGELALMCGVDQSTVWRWEHGTRRVPAWVDVILDTLEQDQASMVTDFGWLLRMRRQAGA